MSVDLDQLNEVSNRVRRNSLKMIAAAGSGHPGGALSAVEILVVLYLHEMNHRPDEPTWADRDRFVLSKGHGCPALYAVLAESGYVEEAELINLRKLGSPFQGHPDRRKLDAIEACTGSLGQGLSLAIGMALGLRNTSRVYCMIGDGESQEGQVWEAAMFAPTHNLDNLCAITDWNKLQLDDRCDNIIKMGSLADKWRAFGWHVVEIDGHDLSQVIQAFESFNQTSGKPTMIIAETVKGKGVSFMEDAVEWHGIAPNQDQLAAALAELGEGR